MLILEEEGDVGDGRGNDDESLAGIECSVLVLQDV